MFDFNDIEKCQLTCFSLGLTLTPTEFNNGSFWVYQKGKIIGEIYEPNFNDSGNDKWTTNTRQLPMFESTNHFGAMLLELIQQPISAIPCTKVAAIALREGRWHND